VLKELSAEVRKVKPTAIMAAENTTDTGALALYYGATNIVRGGDEMPLNFNFPLASALIEGVDHGNANGIRQTLRDMIRLYPPGIIDAPFLANHDHTRLATTFAGDSGKMRSAAAILLTLPGTPFVYYGEEVGLRNGPTSADEWKRTPMPWSAAGGFTTGTPWHAYATGIETENVASQTNDPQSLLSSYRNWIAARKRSAGLMKGDLTLLDSASQVLAFVRSTADERVLVVHNLSASTIDAGPLALDAAALETIYADGGANPSGGPGAWRVSLPPHGSGVWRTR
jgi:glycosidase